MAFHTDLAYLLLPSLPLLQILQQHPCPLETVAHPFRRADSHLHHPCSPAERLGPYRVDRPSASACCRSLQDDTTLDCSPAGMTSDGCIHHLHRTVVDQSYHQVEEAEGSHHTDRGVSHNCHCDHNAPSSLLRHTCSAQIGPYDPYDASRAYPEARVVCAARGASPRAPLRQSLAPSASRGASAPSAHHYSVPCRVPCFAPCCRHCARSAHHDPSCRPVQCRQSLAWYAAVLSVGQSHPALHSSRPPPFRACLSPAARPPRTRT